MMQDNSNFGVAILELSRQFPDRVALRIGDRVVTFGALLAAATRYALHMRANGITAGSCVALSANAKGAQAVALALACALIGCRWLTNRNDMPVEALGLTHVLAINEWPVPRKGVTVLAVNQRWNEPPEGSPADQMSFSGFASPDAIAMYGWSSGTTGAAKYVARSCGYIWELIQDRKQTTDFQTISILFPLLFAPGFRLVVGALLAGTTIVIGRGVAELAALGAEAVYGSPAQIETLIEDAKPLEKRLKYVRVGGAKMNVPAVKRWLGYFERIEAAYGSRDGGGVASTVISEIADGDTIVYTPYHDVKIQIIDPEGQALPHDTIGEVRLRTPFTVGGYVGAAEATAEAFRDGWFYPGDLGSLTADGKLAVVGRIKDQFNVGGVKFNASLIDDAAASALGVVEAVAFTVEDTAGRIELCVLVAAKRLAEPPTIAADIREKCRAVGGKAAVPARVYFADKLPQNAMSKVMRSEAAAAAARFQAY